MNIDTQLGARLTLGTTPALPEGTLLVATMQAPTDPRQFSVYLDPASRRALIEALTEAEEAPRELTGEERMFVRDQVIDAISTLSPVESVYDAFSNAYGEDVLSKMEDKIEAEITRLIEKATEAL